MKQFRQEPRGNETAEKRSAEAPALQTGSVNPANEPPAPRGTRTRPPAKQSVRLLGDKVTVLEGKLDPHGSDGPVRLGMSNGTVISAHKLAVADDGSLVLTAPLSRTGGPDEPMAMEEGVATLKADGSFATEGVVWTDPDFFEPDFPENP